MAKKRMAVDWISYEKDELEALIGKMAKEGMPAAAIGLRLRDQYGIPNVSQFGLKISKIVQRESSEEVPEDIYSLLSQVVKLHHHLEKNKHDGKARHALDTMESKVRKLAKYYVRRKHLPSDWKYSLDKAKLLVKG